MLALVAIAAALGGWKVGGLAGLLCLALLATHPGEPIGRRRLGAARPGALLHTPYLGA